MMRACLFAAAAVSAALIAAQPARSSDRGDDLSAMTDSANVLVMRGRCDEAIPMLERIMALSQRIGAAHEMLADCYLRAGRAQEAAELLERCVAEEPGREFLIQRLGLAYLDLAQKDKAIEAWRRLIKADEKNPSTYGIVARMERDAGLYDEAISTLREGAKIKGYGESYRREAIRLERTIGRDEEAFREALVLAGGRAGTLDGEIRGLYSIFKESKRQERLAAIADSMAGAADDREGVYRTIRSALLVDAALYTDARRLVFANEAPRLREEVLYALVAFMGRMTDRRDDTGFTSLATDLMQQYLDRFGASAAAPGVMLMMAETERQEARNAAPGERERLLGEALAAAGGVRLHPFGAAFLERSCVFKAQVLFEDLHRGEDALRELGGMVPPGPSGAIAVEELRVRILLAMSDGRGAAKWFERLAAGPDTTVAILGRYALGRLAFLDGRFEESMKILSELAEKHPSSKWANDALDLAMEIKGAMGEEGGTLELYRVAVLAVDRGDHAAAIDSFAALGRRFPQSFLAAPAIFRKACLEADSHAGAPLADSARADFERLAESYPLHDLAPRALEELAALAERANPAEAAARYGRIMELYPDYPFMERVRERYISLNASAGAAAPAGAPTRGSK